MQELSKEENASSLIQRYGITGKTGDRRFSISIWMTIIEKGETFSSSVHLTDEDFTLRMVSERTRSGAGSLTQDMELLVGSEMIDVEAPWSSDYDRNTLRV